jgi:leucyl-tRNA---protein transferase
MSVFAEKHYPEVLQAEDLDSYLERGWYRMGQSIFTTHFLCFGDQLYSAIWIRLNASEHQYSKSQRKLLRRNATRFTVRYAPSELTAEKEALYQKYKQNFPGFIARSLQESLLDGEISSHYHTLETQVYDGDQLVALSFFDLGQDSVASILGIYDPDYQGASLGYYTMLLEIAYCQQHGITYYYPGYIVPGYQRFDYKLRIGQVEYLQLSSGTWQPYIPNAYADIPLLHMRQQLEYATSLLKAANVLCHLYWYPLFEANLFGLLRASYLDFPVVLQVPGPLTAPHFTYFIVYDVRNNRFQLLRCSNFDDFRFYFNDSYAQAFNPHEFLVELIVVENLLLQTTTAEEMVKIIVANHDKLI